MNLNMLNKNNTFCVSLNKQHPARTLNTRDKFNNQAKCFGMDFRYFDAVDGDEIKLYNDNSKNNDKQTVGRTKCGISFRYTPSKLITQNCANSELSFYYIGCALSHLKLYENLLFDKDNDYYLIFEDDFIFSKKYTYTHLVEDINKIPKDADICFFAPPHCSPFTSYSKQNDVDNHIYMLNKNNRISGTSMYLITKLGAEKLLNIDGMNVNWASDEFLQMSLGILNAYNTHKMYGFGHLERLNYNIKIIETLDLNY